MKIKNIIFDWGGVLIDLDMKGCIKAFEEIGIHDFYQLITGAEETGIFKTYELGNCTTSEFHEAVRNLANRPLTDEDIDHVWNAMVKSVPEEKLQLLAELKEQYAVYLLSNTNELHWEYASDKVFQYKGMKREDFFKETFLSFRMHLAKPDTEIFRTALQEANLNPGETLFIDDSPINCEAASAVQLQTLHYIPGTDLRTVLSKKLCKY